MTSVFYNSLYDDAGIPLHEGITHQDIPNPGTQAALAGLNSIPGINSFIVEGQQFSQTYRQLFPDDDPLDTSNQILPTASPSTDLREAQLGVLQGGHTSGMAQLGHGLVWILHHPIPMNGLQPLGMV